MLLIEQLLDDAGVSTERSILNTANGDERYTHLEMLEDCLASNAGNGADEEHAELLQRVNQAFRPWIKPRTARR